MNKIISLIIPTYNEASNIKPLFKGIHSVLNSKKYEIILVDDSSPDGTAKKAEEFKDKYPLKVILRKEDRDLSKAVITGLNHAKGDILGVMDADLAHPVKVMPIMIELINKGYADIVVGSRLIEGGAIKNWPLSRKIISKIATLLAKPLTNIKDPMSGFFFLKKEVIKSIEFKSKGYKILLEMLVKGKYKKVVEIPIIFKNRIKGKSKLTKVIYLKYLKQLIGLYYWRIKAFFKK